MLDHVLIALLTSRMIKPGPVRGLWRSSHGIVAHHTCLWAARRRTQRRRRPGPSSARR